MGKIHCQGFYVFVCAKWDHHDNAVFLKYGVSEISFVLLAAVFVDLYGVVDRKCIWKIYEPRSIEMEPMMKNACNITMESVLRVKVGV